jgi:hypothetical protein
MPGVNRLLIRQDNLRLEFDGEAVLLADTQRKLP